MTERTKQQDAEPRSEQLLSNYRAWYEAFMHEHTAALARSRLLALHHKETPWNWLSL